MFNTFKAEFAYLIKNKWRLVSFLILLFIPFLYGFLYMNAYWSPFKNVNNLKIAVVSQDISSGKESAKSNYLKNNLIKEGEIKTDTNQIYTLVEDQKLANDPKSGVDSGDYDAVIIIPKGYDVKMEKFKKEIINNPLNFTDQYNKIFNDENLKVKFYYSYKNSYLTGEIMNFVSMNTKLVLKSLFPFDSSSINIIGSLTGADVIGKIMNMAGALKNQVIEIKQYGNEVFNSYGTGLSPYFISIAIWAGALTTLFVVKNKRHVKTESTIKHLFGKLMVWWVIGFLQVTILMTAVTLQGVNIGATSQWKLFLFAYFMNIVFTTIVMFSAYSIRYGDIGEFIVVIMLVLQLISSSGTFPSEMQNILFRILNPIVPFTYTIKSLREIMWDTNVANIFINMAILMIFPIIAAPLSIYINYRYDNKMFKKNKTYDSYEIHVGDY